MPVNSEHPDYRSMSNKWDRCIDVCKGQDAVHAKGELYLPMLSEQTDKEYDAYKKRATFYNATWRTISGLQGMIFRKPPQLKAPKKVLKMLENVDLQGTTMHMFALKVAEECLKLGRVGVFTDYPEVAEGATQADAEKRNYRPSLKMYTAKSIINWKTKTIDNACVLSMVVLKEIVEEDLDVYTSKEVTQYRVLELVEELVKGVKAHVYRVRVVIMDKDGNESDKSVVYPRIKGEFLDRIPFQFMGVDDVSWEVDEPPLIDLVDLNLAHYRVTADYEHGCHFTGLPTPVVSGITDEDIKNNNGKFCIGSTTAWVFRRHEATAKFLEFTGAGLSSLKENLDGKETKMAIMGARMLEPQQKGVESSETAAIHHGGEQSTLSSVAQAISMGLTCSTKSFTRYAEEDDEDVSVELNRDFFPVPMDSLKLTAIIAGWQNGAYSYDTMFANLKKGEIVPVDATPEDERKAIKANPPPVMGAKEGAATVPGDVENKSPKTSAAPATPAPTQTQLRNNGGSAS